MRVLLSEGWDVTAVGRSRARLGGLTARLGSPERLRTAVAAGSAAGWDLPAAAIDGSTLAVASLGGWYSGPPLTDLSMREWNGIVDDGLTAHLRAAQALLPVLEATGGATYVMINGAAAWAPVSGSGAVSVVASAQLMLAEVLAAEARTTTVRSLVLATPVLTRARPVGPQGWISAEHVGHAVLALHRDPGERTTVTLGTPPSRRVPGSSA